MSSPVRCPASWRASASRAGPAGPVGAGGPRRALPLLTDAGSTRFLIVNGDTLTNVDLDALIQRHESSGALVTMSLIRNPAPDKYGGVRVSADAFVTGFTRAGREPESCHFIGVQLAEARAFADLPDGVRYESVNDLYPELMRRDPRAVAAFISTADFNDIGTPADCLATSLALADSEGNRMISRTTEIASDAVVHRSALWDDVKVERGVRLTECIVADAVRIPRGASFTRCAIVPAGSRAAAADERLENGLLIRPF